VEDFKKSIATGRTTYTEYRWAVAELQGPGN
jgi:hypothetical protein